MTRRGVPRPGSPLGPCDGECEHQKCERQREIAGSYCEICNLPIGYETLIAKTHSYRHLDCHDAMGES